MPEIFSSQGKHKVSQHLVVKLWNVNVYKNLSGNSVLLLMYGRTDGTTESWGKFGRKFSATRKFFNPLAPNDVYIYISYRTANLQTLHFKYLLNKYTYWIFWTCYTFSVFFLQDAVYFIMLPFLVPVLLTF